MSGNNENPHGIGRRRFLAGLLASGAGAAAVLSEASAAMGSLVPLAVDNPLTTYPNRDWEKVYRNLYAHDSTFTFLCAPNDTHNCLLKAFVKNGVVTRIGPTYGFQKATDLDGKAASGRWDPRCCQKGLALARRFYGDRRVKRPMVRQGFLDWARLGFPRDPKTGAPDPKYMNRGRDKWVAVAWDEAINLEALALVNIAKTYTGDAGKQRLLAQGYDPLMVDATGGAGTQVLKFRGGMPALGITRIFAQYRMANAMALLDDKIRGTGPEKAVGARGWDNYSWHTDLPPGHPMVTGHQTNDFDLSCVEYSKLILAWGVNWITTKMPDGHWLTEARMKGAKVVVIAAEYSATANKADEVLIVRPGTTPALALGLAQVMMSEKLYDADYVKSATDLPLLIRMDTGDLLKATDVFADYKLAELKNATLVLKDGETPPKGTQEAGAVITEAQRKKWGDHVMWDARNDRPVAVNRDQVDRHFLALGIDPQLEGEVEVKLADGKSVVCRPVFDVTKQICDGSYKPEDVEKLTWAPADAVRGLARQIAANKETTAFAMGMGPNQFFNSDLKDRAVFLVAALTKNIGRVGGNVGSFAGNFRAAFFNGLPQYFGEDPFDIESDPSKPARVKVRWKAESVHYWNHGDKILKVGDAVLTGKSHMPTPTKSIHVSNSNSLIGNVKGHYEVVVNGLPKVELLAINEWWWTASCEYADIVFPVDSWAEMKYPDMTMSVTNPFLYVFPPTPLPRIHDTRSDMDVAAGVCRAVGRFTDDNRHDAYWQFVEKGGVRPYIQRILDASTSTRGFKIDDLEAKAKNGIPAIIQTRTYPKWSGYEQTMEAKPYYTRSGRLEFYRDEPEFKNAGENMVVHREPIDSTFYEPNVIVANAHPLLKPKQLKDYGLTADDLSADTRQARNVVLTVEELMKTKHPLMSQPGFRFIFHTPKYRHGAHTTPVDTDIVAIWFGPFGDMYRTDKRKPFITEAFIDVNPHDAKELGVEDGDYVYIDADPHDRPFVGWQEKPDSYQMARLLVRCRYYSGTPRGVTRMWHNMYGATYGSHAGHTDPKGNGLAKSPTTGYQSLFRGGSHQSCTRGWIKPTWMTDTLTIKALFGQRVTQGFVPDVHCPTGAPRESMVRITKAEAGGPDGVGLWAPASLGLRPTYERQALKDYMAGKFVSGAAATAG